MSAGAGAAVGCGLEGRVILHLDADCFYAQVEHKRLGIPRENPLAVQQWNGLIAVNYPARAKGVGRFMAIDEAKKVCPELELVHVELIGEKDHEKEKDEPLQIDRAKDKVTLQRYRVASAEIFAVLQRFGTVEKASIDEAYLDVTKEAREALQAISGEADDDDDGEAEAERRRILEPSATGSSVYGELDLGLEGDCILAAAASVCAAARAAVKGETGYTLSAGISHNKMLAKLASAQNKPDKQTIVPAAGIQSLMETLPIKKIRGLGGKLGAEVCRALVDAGILGSEREEADLMACDLQGLPESTLSRLFGAKTAAWLYRVCRGFDDDEVKERDKAKSMLAFKSFSKVDTPEGVSRWLRVLSDELAERLVGERDANARLPRTLTLHYRGASHKSAQGSRSGPIPTPALVDGVTEQQMAAVLLQHAKILLGKAKDAFPCTRLALGATDFMEIATGNNSISHFFSSSALAAAAPRREVSQAASQQQQQQQQQQHCSSGAHSALHPPEGQCQGTGDASVHRQTAKVESASSACGERDSTISSARGAMGTGGGKGMIESMFAKQQSAAGGGDGEGFANKNGTSKYEEGMATLAAMGFAESGATRAALDKAGGDVGAAIEALLGTEGSALRGGAGRGDGGRILGGGKAAAGGKKRAQGSMNIASMFAKQARR